ncbi:hypothetical protein KC330_g7789 [Hortaea werneckii]|nr:hypothetical protein KC330_g7789 [Hortaea werneckii]
MPQLVWFVTGCSTGFGAEFSKVILSKGDYVIATARNVQNLDGLKAMGAATMQLDVNEPFPNIKEKMHEALGIYGRIDVLLSNAGYAEFDPVEHLAQVSPGTRILTRHLADNALQADQHTIRASPNEHSRYRQSHSRFDASLAGAEERLHSREQLL